MTGMPVLGMAWITQWECVVWNRLYYGNVWYGMD